MKPAIKLHSVLEGAFISVLSALLLGALACAGGAQMSQPSVPWDQQAATLASAAFSERMGQLYDTALKNPAFAGERSAYGKTLNDLRELEEKSGELHAQLADGKSREQTQDDWKRIMEISRDAKESDAWEFVPEDFAAAAKSALASTKQLDAFYGVR